MPQVSNRELEKLDNSLNNLEQSIDNLEGERSGFWFSSTQQSSTGRGVDGDLQIDPGKSESTDVEKLFAEIERLNSKVNAVQKNAKRWRQLSWLWRIVSFVVGTFVGSAATTLL